MQRAGRPALTGVVAAVLLAGAGEAPAEGRFPARVVVVIDGDTLVVRDDQHRRHEIRLAGIDAPEIRQAYGTRSRAHLAELTYGKQVIVGWTKRDRYGRLIARLTVQDCARPPCPAPLDPAQAQLAAGYAWHDKPHADEQRPDERVRYSRTELEARARHAGLWAATAPLAPWVYRQRYRRP